MGLKIAVSQRLIAWAFSMSDWNALAVAVRRDVDVDELRKSLASYIESDLKPLVIDGSRKSKLTAAFKRWCRARCSVRRG